MSQKQTPSSISLGLTHTSIDANNLECDLFSVTEPSTTNTILQKQGRLTNFFPIVHQSPVSNLTVRIDMAYPNYLVDASTKGTIPGNSIAILEHEEHNIDEKSTAEQDPLLTNPSSKNRSSVAIGGNKKRRKKNDNNNNKYNNASFARLADPGDKNRAMRHDKDSNFTSSKESIANSKLKITRSFRHTNTRLSYVRSKILPTSSHKKR